MKGEFRMIRSFYEAEENRNNFSAGDSEKKINNAITSLMNYSETGFMYRLVRYTTNLFLRSLNKLLMWRMEELNPYIVLARNRFKV